MPELSNGGRMSSVIASKQRKKIVIFGDSFGASKPNYEFPGWVEMLQDYHNVTNFCQHGVSQYKIYQQILQADLAKFDHVIVTHTSPFRVFVRENLLHKNDPIYKNCDLIFLDIENRTDEFSVSAQQYFKYIYDIEYTLDIHNMICDRINSLLANKPCTHITHFDYSSCYRFPNLKSFHDVWQANRGTVHHYNQKGNKLIFDYLVNLI